MVTNMNTSCVNLFWSALRGATTAGLLLCAILSAAPFARAQSLRGVKSAPIVQAAQQAQVTIGATGFNPLSVTIAVGDSVRWTNTDTREHALSGLNGSLNSGALAVGASFEFTFAQAGRFFVFDSRSERSMTIIVQGAELPRKLHLPLTSRG